MVLRLPYLVGNGSLRSPGSRGVVPGAVAPEVGVVGSVVAGTVGDDALVPDVSPVGSATLRRRVFERSTMAVDFCKVLVCAGAAGITVGCVGVVGVGGVAICTGVIEPPSCGSLASGASPFGSSGCAMTGSVASTCTSIGAT